MCIVSSLFGLAYAAGVCAAWGWRWALVAYTPLLIAARLVMASQIRGLRVSDDGGARPPLLPAAVMAAGVAVIGLAPTGIWLRLAGPAGAAALIHTNGG